LRNAETCSPRCYGAHKTKTVAKVCPICGNEFFARGKTCSPEHAIELKKRTNREKFGSDWAIQTKAAKEKRVATNIEKFGAPHHLQTQESLKKMRETNRERYGADYVIQSDEAKKKIAETNLRRYGAENPFASEEVKEKIRKINLEKYGVEYPSQNKEIKQRQIDTSLKRYGVANPFQSEEIKEKIKKTLLEKYGVEYPSQSPAVQDRFKQTMLERYGVEHPMHYPDFVQKLAESREKGVASGKIFRTVSKHNLHFAKKIEEKYGVKVTLEKAVDGKSFDLFIESRNLLIELNPYITHNYEIPYACLLNKCPNDCQEHQVPSKNSHFMRSKIAFDNNMKLVQAYEWDEKENLFSILDGKLLPAEYKFSARKLRAQKIPSKEASVFFKENHIQGDVKRKDHSYGLFNGETLVAAASFGRARFGAKSEFEWLRYAVSRRVIIHGGSNLLFNFFKNDVTPESVISYIDFNHTTSQYTFLNSCGFIEAKPTGPKLMWFNPRTGKLISDTSVLAIGADRILGTNYGPLDKCGMNNNQILQNEGFGRIYTAGNRVFKWEAP